MTADQAVARQAAHENVIAEMVEALEIVLANMPPIYLKSGVRAVAEAALRNAKAIA